MQDLVGNPEDRFSHDAAQLLQLLPFLVMDKLTFLQGLPGLFVACLFSASLSSISSGLNALAIVILEDIVKLIWEWRNINPSATTIARLAKVIGKNKCIESPTGRFK